MTELLSNIESYWTRRAPSYTAAITPGLNNKQEELWAEALISRFPAVGGAPLKVLDIGTGPGYYAIILTRRGYHVTAVDYTQAMLDEARRNAGELAAFIDFRRMDAHSLDLADASFDVIVTRNLTWNLEDPARAYADWKRVLRPGGRLLNFDANWYSYLFDEEKRRAFAEDRLNTRRAGLADHNAYSDSGTMENIAENLPLGAHFRPQWDVVTLLDLGFSTVSADMAICQTLWNDEEKVNYASTPGFLICAEK